MRPTITTLITKDLHYCCMWAFFSIFKKRGEIADRLGVSTRTVNRAKADFRAGKMKCKGCERCMKEQVRIIKLCGKKALGIGQPTDS
jgi:hypothetical protein